MDEARQRLWPLLMKRRPTTTRGASRSLGGYSVFSQLEGRRATSKGRRGRLEGETAPPDPLY